MDFFKHLIFYDGKCPLCNRTVQFVLAQDKENIFGFAPLDGETAKKEISDLLEATPNLDAIVLLQNFGTNKEETLIEGKASLRILWLLGGGYVLLGWLSFLPSFLFDAIYRLFAKYRYKIFKKKTTIDTSKGHFLP